jgi:tRNA-dihydrouridine synthase
MLGRAIYGNPWLFKNIDTIRAEKQGDISPHAPTREEKVAALIEHLQLFDKLQSGNTNYAVMKKHFKAYISGWESAKELRIQLMDTQSVKESLDILTKRV